MRVEAGSGMIIVNPPWTLRAREAQEYLLASSNAKLFRHQEAREGDHTRVTWIHAQ